MFRMPRAIRQNMIFSNPTSQLEVLFQCSTESGSETIFLHGYRPIPVYAQWCITILLFIMDILRNIILLLSPASSAITSAFAALQYAERRRARQRLVCEQYIPALEQI